MFSLTKKNSQELGSMNTHPNANNNGAKRISVSRPPTIVKTGMMTGVKGQVAGLGAEHPAKAGFIILAFNHRNFGGSEGTPRQKEDPVRKIEDLKKCDKL
jgi:hypothetical protein